MEKLKPELEIEFLSDQKCHNCEKPFEQDDI